MTRHIHLVIPDLFLPRELAAAVSSGWPTPALDMILGRAAQQELPARTLESWLCNAFGVADEAIAPVTLSADGTDPGVAYWLRADPVHLRVERDHIALQPVALSANEAIQLCSSLNEHFSADGLRFVAPHPQRWYLQLDNAPHISTLPLAQVVGKDVQASLPHGPDALYWHRMLNEIQMVLFKHPVNEARESRGEWMVNSVWLWGGGYAAGRMAKPFQRMLTDSPLAAAFSAAAGISHAALPEDREQCLAYCVEEAQEEMLIVCEGLRLALQHDDLGGWRDALRRLELNCAQPLLEGLRRGRVETITVDALHDDGSTRFVLRRGDIWKFWRRRRERFALM